MILSRKESLQQGLLFYDADRPCKNGHMGKRYASTGQCVECKKLIQPVSDVKRISRYGMVAAPILRVHKDDLQVLIDFAKMLNESRGILPPLIPRHGR